MGYNLRKYYRKVTQEELISAKTDDKVLLNVLHKVKNYIHHVVNIMYHYYGAKYDNSISKEDLFGFVQSNIMSSIRLYYNPKKYIRGKDKNNKYKDGFYYINKVTEKLIRHYWIRYHRQKRIPPEYVISIDDFINSYDNNSLTVGSTLFYNKQHELKSIFIEPILMYFKENNEIVNGISIYNLVKDIISVDMPLYDSKLKFAGIEELAKKYKTSVEVIESIIKSKIVQPFVNKKNIKN